MNKEKKFRYLPDTAEIQRIMKFQVLWLVIRCVYVSLGKCVCVNLGIRKGKAYNRPT